MPDLVVPALMAPVKRDPRRPPRRDWLDAALIGSALVHVLLLAIILFARRLHVPPAPQPEEPGFEMVFQGGEKSPRAVPVPGRHLSIPNGAAVPSPPTASSQPSPTTPPQAAPAPEVNLLPPELQWMVPPQAQPDEQAAQQPQRTERRRHARSRTAPNASPFAHPQEFSFASRPSASVPRGLRGSKSLDMQLGLLVRGGMLTDAVPHVTSPGADGDYLEQLNEYVETHKFYPEQAAANQESGVSVIRATILRDGTVRDVQLVESSGSRWLDMGWISLFRGKRLEPFPDDMKENQQVFTMSMDYELIYH